MSIKDDLVYEEYQERIRSEQVPCTIIFDSKEEREAYERSVQQLYEYDCLLNKQKNNEEMSFDEKRRLQKLIEYYKPQEGLIIYDDDEQ